MSTQFDKLTILVVDDMPDNLALMNSLLKDEYKVKIANSGKTAIQIANSETPPDLILLDIMMPEMDGYEVCRQLKSNPKTIDIPIIFLTALSEFENEKRGLELGAVDYVTKPISPYIFMARIKNHLALKSMADFLKKRNSFLKIEVAKRTHEIESGQDVTILAMTSLAETRDSDTGNHIRRTQHYVKALAEELRDHPKFSWFLTDTNINLLFKSAPLHDIGKVGIPDSILLKPGKLSPEEFEIMKTHTTLGYEAIVHAENSLGAKVEFLTCAKSIILSHQEKWNGSGYPQGLSGEDIPIAARLMAVADVYDALICRRVYKEPIPHLDAVGIMTKESGIHFDADIIKAFIAIQDEFLEISKKFSDSPESLEKKAVYFQQAMGSPKIDNSQGNPSNNTTCSK
jgi:putative two-component system response regulator